MLKKFLFFLLAFLLTGNLSWAMTPGDAAVSKTIADIKGVPMAGEKLSELERFLIELRAKEAKKIELQQQINAMKEAESWKFFLTKNFKGDRIAIIRYLVAFLSGPQQEMAQDFIKRYDNLQTQLKALG